MTSQKFCWFYLQITQPSTTSEPLPGTLRCRPSSLSWMLHYPLQSLLFFSPYASTTTLESLLWDFWNVNYINLSLPQTLQRLPTEAKANYHNGPQGCTGSDPPINSLPLLSLSNCTGLCHSKLTWSKSGSFTLATLPAWNTESQGSLSQTSQILGWHLFPLLFSEQFYDTFSMSTVPPTLFTVTPLHSSLPCFFIFFPFCFNST